MILVRDNYKESVASFPINKASNNSHSCFYYYFFFFFFSQPVSVIVFFVFFLCYLLRYPRNWKNLFNVESLYHKDNTVSRRLNKVKPCSAGSLPAFSRFWKNVRINSTVWFLKCLLFVNLNQNWTNRVTWSTRSYLLNYFTFYIVPIAFAFSLFMP